MRRRSRRWAPPPRARAEVGGQRADVGARRALDLDRVARPGSSASPTSKRWTVTGPGLALDLDALAGQLVQPPPSTFTADTIGGTCRMSPVSAAAAARTSSSVTPRHVPGAGRPRRTRRASRWPCRARSRPCRSWPARPRKRSSRVTLPTPSSSTPVASGSSVPEWPTLRVPSSAAGLGHHVVAGPAGRLVDDGQPVGPGRSRLRHRLVVVVDLARGPLRGAAAPRPTSSGLNTQLGRALHAGLAADGALQARAGARPAPPAPLRRRPRPRGCRSTRWPGAGRSRSRPT